MRAKLGCFLLLLGLLAMAGVAADAERSSFWQPASICQVLAKDGLPTSEWRRNSEGFEGTLFNAYNCLSGSLIIAGGGNGPFVTSLNYFAEGRTNDRVEIVKLVLNVHDRKTRDAGRVKFIAASKTLLGALGVAPTATLFDALEKQHAGEFAFPDGRVRFEIWTTPAERQRLTIESIAARER